MSGNRLRDLLTGNANPEGINQYTKGSAEHHAALFAASAKLGGLKVGIKKQSMTAGHGVLHKDRKLKTAFTTELIPHEELRLALAGSEAGTEEGKLERLKGSGDYARWERVGSEDLSAMHTNLPKSHKAKIDAALIANRRDG